MRRMILLCIVVGVLAVEVVNTQSAHYSTAYYQRRYNRRPYTFAQSGAAGTYTPLSGNDEGNSAKDETPEKVRLDVYYETDCPDSMRFITRQLYPLYEDMDDVLDFHLIPYGKASYSYDSETKKYDFRCHHGPSECYGNTLQACTKSLYPDKKDYFNFINCMESYARPSRNGQKCARRLSLDWDKIEKCAKGNEGNRLLHEMAELTDSLNPQLYFVPWIVVNKVFSESNQRTSLRNLRSVVCNTYKGSHPKCQQ